MLTNECHECENFIEFPEHGVGEQIACPHCGCPVVLTAQDHTQPPLAPVPSQEPLSGPASTTAGLADARTELETLVHELASQKRRRRQPASSTKPFRLAQLPPTAWKWVVGSLTILAVAGVIAALWLGESGHQRHEIEHQLAVTQLSDDAAALHAPLGIFKTRWLMSMAEVRKLEPDVKAAAPNVLTEKSSYYDRPCEVSFEFKDDSLLLTSVRFLDAASPTTFEQTQARLVKEFGRMSKPAATNSASLFSRKLIRHFALEHRLDNPNSSPTEAISFYVRGRGGLAAVKADPH